MKYFLILTALITVFSFLLDAQTLSPFTVDSNTVALWHFDEGSGNVLYDASPYHNDGAIHNGEWVEGKYGSALHFDGATSYVIFPNTPSLKQEREFTIEAWFSLDTLTFPAISTQDDRHAIFLSNLGPYPFGGGYQMYISQVPQKLFFHYRTPNGQWVTSQGTSITQAHRFYHVAAVYKLLDSVNVEAKVYLDGHLGDSVVFTKRIQYNNTPYFYLGAHAEGRAFGGWKFREFPGTLDEIRISKVARQPKEFNPPYLATSTGLLDFGFVEVGSTLTKELSFTNTSDEDTLVIDDVTFTNDKFSLTHYPAVVLPNGQITIYVTYSPTHIGVDAGTMIVKVQNAGIPETKIQLIGKAYSGALDTNVVAHWLFDEGEGSVLHDASLYGNNGTIYNAEWVQGRKGKALHFNGKTSYVVLPNSPSLKQEQAFTIEAWVLFDTFQFDSGNNERHATIVSNLGSYPYGGGYQTDVFLGGKYGFSYRAGSPISNFSKRTQLTSTHRYYHLAAVYERVFMNPDTMTVVKTYVDGVMTDSSVFPQKIHYTSTDKFYLGTNRDGRAVGNIGVRELPGILDEIKISKVVRRPDEFGLARMTLSKGEIAFAPVRVGNTRSEQLKAVNISSTDTITVNSILSTNPEFSTDVSYFILPPHGEQSITVTYTPTEAGGDEAVLTFTPTDSAFESAELFVSGTGYEIGEAPQISTVRDVPNDQGKQVRIIWYPSMYDSQTESLRVNEYSVWRKVGDPVPFTTRDFISHGNIFKVGERRFVHLEGELWDFVALLPAVRFEHYAFVAPTLYNSNEYAESWSTFRIAAHTMTGEFFFSPPDSGASYDNVYPLAPRSVTATPVYNRVYLDWSEVEEPDLLEYRIYRSTKREFESSTTMKLGSSSATSYEDMTGAMNERYFYAITSVDSNGNESLEKRISNGVYILDAGDLEELPREFSLNQNYQNPFNPSTIISYALPERSFVTLVVYDILGKPVTTLIEKEVEAGYHDERWIAPQASGIYIYKLSAVSVENPTNSFVQSKKMLFIK